MSTLVTVDHAAGGLRVRRDGRPDYIIPHARIRKSFFSHGHGGQNLNRHMNGIQLVCDLPQELVDTLHESVVEKIHPVIARNMESRDPHLNEAQALHRLAELIQEMIAEPEERVPTRVSKGRREKRLDQKKRHGTKKAARKSTSDLQTLF